MVILFIAQTIEITNFIFTKKLLYLKIIITIFVIHVHKLYICFNKKVRVRWSTTSPKYSKNWSIHV